MATSTLYANASVSGNITSPENALGAPNGTWAGELNTSNFSRHRWRMQSPGTGLVGSGTHTVTLRLRRGSNTGVPSVNNIALWINGVEQPAFMTTFTNINSRTGEDLAFTFPGSLVTSLDQVDFDITLGATGGSPSARNSAQIDSITWSATYDAPATPNYVAGSPGAAAGAATSGTLTGRATDAGSPGAAAGAATSGTLGGAAVAAPRALPTIDALLASGAVAEWFRPHPSTLFQTADTSTPVTGAGQSVNRIQNLADPTRPALASGVADTYQTADGFHWLEGFGNNLFTTALTGTATCHLFAVVDPIDDPVENEGVFTLGLYNGTSGGTRSLGWLNPNTAKVDATNWSALPSIPAPSGASVLEGVFAANAIKGAVDGGAFSITSTILANVVQPASSNFGRGIANDTPNRRLYGAIAFNRELTTTERAGVVADLQSLYKITRAGSPQAAAGSSTSGTLGGVAVQPPPSGDTVPALQFPYSATNGAGTEIGVNPDAAALNGASRIDMECRMQVWPTSDYGSPLSGQQTLGLNDIGRLLIQSYSDGSWRLDFQTSQAKGFNATSLLAGPGQIDFTFGEPITVRLEASNAPLEQGGPYARWVYNGQTVLQADAAPVAWPAAFNYFSFFSAWEPFLGKLQYLKVWRNGVLFKEWGPPAADFIASPNVDSGAGVTDTTMPAPAGSGGTVGAGSPGAAAGKATTGTLGGAVTDAGSPGAAAGRSTSGTLGGAARDAGSPGAAAGKATTGTLGGAATDAGAPGAAAGAATGGTLGGAATDTGSPGAAAGAATDGTLGGAATDAGTPGAAAGKATTGTLGGGEGGSVEGGTPGAAAGTSTTGTLGGAATDAGEPGAAAGSATSGTLGGATTDAGAPGPATGTGTAGTLGGAATDAGDPGVAAGSATGGTLGGGVAGSTRSGSPGAAAGTSTTGTLGGRAVDAGSPGAAAGEAEAGTLGGGAVDAGSPGAAGGEAETGTLGGASTDAGAPGTASGTATGGSLGGGATVAADPEPAQGATEAGTLGGSAEIEEPMLEEDWLALAAESPWIIMALETDWIDLPGPESVWLTLPPTAGSNP